MFKKNLMIVGLAGLMVLGGNMGVYADASVNKAELIKIVPSVITGLTAENSELVRMISLQPAIKAEQVESVYVEFVELTPSEYVESVELTALQPAMSVEMTDEEQAEFEKMKKMSSQELVEYIQLNNPQVIPSIDTTRAQYVLTAE